MGERPPIAAILVPVDFTGYAGQALRWAGRLAAMTKASLLAMHAVPPDELEALSEGECPADEVVQDTETRVREFAALWLGTLAAGCEVRVVVGEAAPAILRVARERRCDLIVIASHDRGSPVTEHLVHESRVPLVVLRPEYEWPAQRQGVRARMILEQMH